MEFPLVAVGIGLLWGGSLLAVEQLFGDHGPRSSIVLTGVLYTLLTMGAMYAALSTNASIMLTGGVAFCIIVLGLLSEKQSSLTKSG